MNQRLSPARNAGLPLAASSGAPSHPLIRVMMFPSILSAPPPDPGLEFYNIGLLVE